MRFSRIKRDDYAFVLEVDFYIFHPANSLQGRSQLSHTFVAIFAFGRDFNRLQDGVIGAFEIERIGWVRIVWSRGIHRFLLSNV